MERDNFIFKTHISFGIQSDTIELDIITKELGIEPAKSSLKKGDTWVGKKTGKIYVRESNIWRIETEWTILEDETVSHHIEYLKSILLPKIDILKKYKDSKECYTSFWIWVETDLAGIGLYLTDDELNFLHSIANYVHFSLLAKDPKEMDAEIKKKKKQ